MNNPSKYAFPKGAFDGLTKRELFTALALQGLLSASNRHPNDMICSGFAETAVEFADALIAVLEEKKE